MTRGSSDATESSGWKRVARDLWGRLEQSPVGLLVRAGTSFVEHRGFVRASALTYTTLLSLVPLIALFLGLAKAFLQDGNDDFLYETVNRFLGFAVPQLDLLPPSEAASARNDVVESLRGAITRINGGALGVFGGLVLVGIAVSLISSVEQALNDVWGVPTGRSFSRKLVNYWAGITLGPLLIFVALGLTGSAAVAGVSGMVPGSRLLFFFVPFLALALVFTLLYLALPNARVSFPAALAGGVAAGALFQANNMASAIYLSRVSTYSKVYGSLGAVPVLMVGTFLAWAIVIFGAEVARAFASGRQPEPDPIRDERSRLPVGLAIARNVAARYLAGRGATRTEDLAAAVGAPEPLVRDVAEDLTQAGILCWAAVGNDDDQTPIDLLPARPPGTIPVLDVVKALERPWDGRADPHVSGFLASMERARRDALGATTLEAFAAPDEPAPS